MTWKLNVIEAGDDLWNLEAISGHDSPDGFVQETRIVTTFPGSEDDAKRELRSLAGTARNAPVSITRKG
jgi:hypothetical protein